MEDIHYIWESLPHVDHARIVNDLKRLGLTQRHDCPGPFFAQPHRQCRRWCRDRGPCSTRRRGTQWNGALSDIDRLRTGSDLTHPPHMDLRTTSCWTGRIPQTALQIPVVTTQSASDALNHRDR